MEDCLPSVIAEEYGPPDVLVMDPPRQGCDQAVVDTLLDFNPARIAYMSCKPSTLARDLNLLCQPNGPYEVEKVQPVDFFPQTYHVECIAFLCASTKI